MLKIIRYCLILAIFCMAAVALLPAANNISKTGNISSKPEEVDAGLKEVMPQAKTFKKIESTKGIVYQKAYDKEGRMLGVVFTATGQGYSSIIKTLVGMLKDGSITAIKVISQDETPSLGTRVTEEDFRKQFSNKDSKDLEDVQAITGATISSKAVIDSVKSTAEKIKELIKDDE